MPSGDRSANPATYGVPGRSNLQRAHISVSSTRKHSGAEMLATPSGVSRAASLAFSCRCAVPGYRTSHPDYTRGQSQETGSLSRLFGSMETTAKCVSVGPAYCRERLQNPVQFSSASMQRGESHSGGPRAGSGNGTRSRYSLEGGGHRGGPSSMATLPPHKRESRFYSRYFIVPKKDGGLRPILDLRQLNRSVSRAVSS